MEALHWMRFVAKMRAMAPGIPLGECSEIYRMLQVNPHWRCGCPNQVMDPDWERLREWIREQMGEDHLGET